MKIEIPNGALIATDNCDFYNVYLLIINESEKTIDLSGEDRMSIGLIAYENLSTVDIHEYKENGTFSGEINQIIKNGEINYD